MKKIIILSLLVLFSTVGCNSSKSSPSKVPSGTTLAKVGDSKIDSGEFVILYDKVNAGRPYGSVSKEEFLNELVRLELGYQEAKKEKLDQTPEIKFQIEATLSQALLQKNLAEKVRSINISDAEMKEYYDKNPQIRASHILLRVPPNADPKTEGEIKKKIDDIYAQAKANKKAFPELAKKYSEDPTGKRGGDLDYFSKDRMVPQFADAAFALKEIGDISPPVKTPFGWHIIELTGKQSFKDADKNVLRQTLLGEKRKNVVEEYFASLKQKYGATIYKENLEELKTAPPPAAAPLPAPAPGPKTK